MAWSKRPKQDLAEQPEQIYPAALAYLTRRDYSVAELREKLLGRGGEPEAVEAVLRRLLDQRYLDDRRFALGRVRQRRDFNGRSRAFVRQELRDLGVAEECLQEALEAEYSPEQEAELLARLVRQELRRLPREAEKEQRRKFSQSVQRRLAGRGFSPGEVYRLVQAALERWEDEAFDRE